MATTIWPAIHDERRSLAEELSGLTSDQWATPSLCAGWSVHDVLAHLLSAAKMTPPRFFVRFAGAGFNFDKFAGRQVELERAGGPEATLAEFRNVQNRTSAPPGPRDTWLGEAFVHGEDIRRPLGIAHDYPLGDVSKVVKLYANSNAIIGGKKRVEGVRLRATDTDCTVGEGPEVAGPVVSLMLAASGRQAALDDLSGPGLATLHSRMS
jgi:uncharacterized protein (TIGR03083 family)